MLGALAIAVGIAVLLFMPDSPAHAQFLSREERIAAIERIRDQQVGTENKRLKKERGTGKHVMKKEKPTEKIEEAIDKLDERIKTFKLQMEDREAGKEVALGTR